MYKYTDMHRDSIEYIHYSHTLLSHTHKHTIYTDSIGYIHYSLTQAHKHTHMHRHKTAYTHINTE